MNGNKIQEKKVWKLVLTGGPCGGKTTGEAEIFLFQCRLEHCFFLNWELLFCYQNCSDPLLEKNVLVIEKDF